MDDLRRELDETYANPMECPQGRLCLLHLVFALASLYRPNDPDSKKLFESGLGMCQDLIENGDFWLVQAYLLIALYYQHICKRNACWVALGTLRFLVRVLIQGIAIRLAQALGMHRACVNSSLPPKDQLLRQRVWRNLYIYDRLYSACLGRPYVIEDEDWDDKDMDASNVDRLCIELTNLSCILGDICRQVYRPRQISSKAASIVSKRLREWASALPPEMSINFLLQKGTQSDSYRQVLLRLHLAHLNAVILLTRPFFFYLVTFTVTHRTETIPGKDPASGTVLCLAATCVMSASRSVDIVYSLFTEGAPPIRPPFLIYFMFLSGLILLVDAYRDPSLIDNPAITNVKFIMSTYANTDPVATRYHSIFEEMHTTIKDDHDRRRNEELVSFGEAIPRNECPTTDPFSVNPLEGKVVVPFPENVLPQFWDGDPFNFEFEDTDYWDALISGASECRGMLLNREF
jgi:Fungal specific transcription factor domain